MSLKFSYCLLIIAIASLSSANAQTEKGSHMVGGTFSMSNFRSGVGQEVWTIAFSPQYGYFISDRIVIGTSLELGLSILPVYSNIDRKKIGTIDVLQTAITPYGRLYFNHLFAELSTGIGTRYTLYNYKGNSSKNSAQSYYTLTPAIGYDLFLNSSIALEAKLSYQLTHRYGEQFRFESFDKNASFQIGLQVFLPGRKNKDLD